MQMILLSREEVSRRAKQLYEGMIRQQVEVEENIGKWSSSTLRRVIMKSIKLA
jgi:hypothetical protein